MLRLADQATRNPLLERLQRIGQSIAFRFVDQQMYVFRHDHVSKDAESPGAPHPLQRLLKEATVRFANSRRR
jgi:hypothetical protein